MVEERPLHSNKRLGCAHWLLLAGFGLASLSGFLRLAGAASNIVWLDQYGVPAAYLEASGAVWGGVALAAILAMVLRRPWSAPAVMGCALFLAITYWADRLLMGKPYGIGLNIPFALVLTLALLGFTWLALRPTGQTGKGLEKKREADERARTGS